jgi:hypothetical protein
MTAKANSTLKNRTKSAAVARTKARKSSGDQPPTVAERNRAIKQIRKLGGTHMPRPANRLVRDTPAETIDRCRQIVSWLACIERPFSDGDLDAAEADVLHMVMDALDHAEKVVRSAGSLADAEVRQPFGNSLLTEGQ